MNRSKRPVARHTRRGTIGGHIVRIDGHTISVNLAKIVYKCSECFGPLERHNFGLRCIDNHDHRRYIHRDRIKQLQARQQKNVKQLEKIYVIRDGKVEIK